MPQPVSNENPAPASPAPLSGAGRFSIEELTGARRSIALGGRSLPRRGVGWGVEMRKKQTWYPGAKRGTIQVLGPQYMDTHLSGAWKDRFLRGQVEASGFAEQFGGRSNVLSASHPTTAAELVAVFYSICQAGNALRVSWQNETREGILASFLPTYGVPSGNDVEWEMVFAWEGAGEPPAVVSTEEPDARAQQRQEMANVDNAAASPTTTNNATRSLVATTQRSTRTLGGGMFDALRSIPLSFPPLEPVSSLVSLTEQMRTLLEDERERLADVPRQVTTLSDRVLDLVNVESWRRSLSAAQRDLEAGCMTRASNASKKVLPGALTVVTVPGSTTLRDLSLTYYGSADDWQRIADTNGLSDSYVAAGTVLVIPPPGA